MSENFIITLECSRDALGELIATGLEHNATITTLKSAQTKMLDMTNRLSSVTVCQPSQVSAASAINNDQSNRKKMKRRLTCWDAYEVARDFFQTVKTFTAHDLDAAISLRYERAKPNNASAHLHHMNRAEIVRRVDGCTSTGYVYVIRKNLNRHEFQELYHKRYSSLEGV